MARIIDITPKSQDVRPVLLLLTSHRVDCFLLCIKCLELYTDLDRFKKIYVVANDVSDEHAVIVKSFQRRHPNVIDVHATPRGQIPAVVSMENFILERHRNDVVLRLSEDVFVTPHWLERMLGAYKLHRGRRDVPVISAMSPISRTGRQVMDRVLRAHYPDERTRLPMTPLESNGVYHRFMWEKILHDGLMEKYFAIDRPRQMYLGHISVDCILFDGDLIKRVAPMPLRMPEGVSRADEFYINGALRKDNLRGAVVMDAVAHHFSHAGPEAFLRRHVSMDDIWWHMMFLDQGLAAPGEAVAGQPRARLTGPETRRLMRERNMTLL